MFNDLQVMNRIESKEYPKGFAGRGYSEAVEYLGAKTSLKQVSVGHYENDCWIEERTDRAWCADDTSGLWLPCWPIVNIPAKSYLEAKEYIGHCSLSRLSEDTYVWVADGDAQITIPALLPNDVSKPMKYSSAHQLLGPCQRFEDKDGKHWWVSASPECEAIRVLAELPELFPPFHVHC